MTDHQLNSIKITIECPKIPHELVVIYSLQFFEFHLTAWNLAIAYKCYIVLYKYSWDDFSLKILLYVILRMHK